MSNRTGQFAQVCTIVAVHCRSERCSSISVFTLGLQKMWSVFCFHNYNSCLNKPLLLPKQVPEWAE